MSTSRKTALFLCSLLISFSSINSYSLAAANNELVFLTWSEYMDPEIVTAFEKEFKAKIKFVYFETDDTRDDLLVQTDADGYDLILVNGPSINKFYKRNWIAPITTTETPNLKHIDKKWLTLFKKADGNSMPYFWGTTGIAYRKDLIKGKVDSWNHLFKPQESQRGKIAMVRSSVDTISIALKSLNYSANSESREELMQAEKLLKAQKPYVRNYSYISLSKKSALVSGDVQMSVAYSGDALILKDLNENIEYVLPKEGGMIWIDSIVVAEKSKNKKLAYDFLNFLNRPEIAKKNAKHVYCATPNKAAEKLLDKKFLSNSVIYPSKEALSKSETYGELKPRTNRLRNQIFSNLVE